MIWTRMLLLKVPTFWLGLMVVVLTVLAATGGLLLVRRLVDVRELRSTHDIAGPIFNTLGVLYAVWLAFVVIVSWQNYDRARIDAVAEANNYANIYRNSAGFSETFRAEVQRRMNEYLKAVVEDEWPRLGRGERSPLVGQRAGAFWAFFSSYCPTTETEKIFYAETVRPMNEAGELWAPRLRWWPWAR